MLGTDSARSVCPGRGAILATGSSCQWLCTVDTGRAALLQPGSASSVIPLRPGPGVPGSSDLTARGAPHRDHLHPGDRRAARVPAAARRNLLHLRRCGGHLAARSKLDGDARNRRPGVLDALRCRLPRRLWRAARPRADAYRRLAAASRRPARSAALSRASAPVRNGSNLLKSSCWLGSDGGLGNAACATGVGYARSSVSCNPALTVSDLINPRDLTMQLVGELALSWHLLRLTIWIGVLRRALSRDRTRCPRCPASRCTTHCRHQQAVAARVPRRARPVVCIRPQARPGALHPRARCRPARQDAADS